MSNRLSDDKAQLIASCYCTNGFNKVEALLSAGYKPSYAKTIGLKLYDNIKVKTYIAQLQAIATTKTGYTIEQALQEYEEARQMAMATKQVGSAVSAISGKARIVGLEQSALATQPLQITVNQEPAAETAAVPAPSIKLTNIA